MQRIGDEGIETAGSANSTAAEMASNSPASDEARVFISYSRRDAGAAEDLRDRLIASGFTAYLDKHDIAPGEDWRARLGGLIESADCVVFLISPDSITSDICDWEVNHAELTGKRIIPVVCRDPGDEMVPPRLGRLNFVFMRTPAESESALANLSTALALDIDWVRKHTRYGELALEWERAGRPARLLLRGAGITEAEAWRDRRRPSAPELTAPQSAYITESRREATRQQRRIVVGSIAAAIVSIGLAVTAYVFQQQAQRASAVAEEQRAIAQERQEEAERQRSLAQRNETVGIAAMSNGALRENKPSDAVKLALAAWPREGDGRLPMRHALDALANALPMLRERMRFVVDGDDAIRAVAYSPDGKSIAGGGLFGSIYLWDPQAGDRVGAIATDGYSVEAVTFSPDGQSVVAAVGDKTVRIWDAERKSETRRLQHGSDESWLIWVEVSGDGKVVAGTSKGEVRVWNLATGERLADWHLTVSEWAHAYDLSPDGTKVVSVADSGARIWDVMTGTELHLLSPGDGFTTAAFTHDGRFVMLGGTGMPRLWNAETGQEAYRLDWNGGESQAIAFSPDMTRFVSVQQGTAIVFDLTLAEIRELLRFPLGPSRVESIAYAPDGRRLASAHVDGTVRLWDVETSYGKRSIVAHGTKASAVAISPDQSLLATASWDRSVALWDVASGKEVRRISMRDRLGAVAFSPDGNWLATGAWDGTITVLDVHTGKEDLTVTPHRNRVRSVRFSADGSSLLSASEDKTIVVSDIASGRETLRLLGHEGYATAAVFSPDGRLIVTASDDSSVRVWDAMSGKELLRLLGHSDAVLDVALDPTGRLVASASKDQTARVWRLDDGRELARLRGHEGNVDAVAFTPDGDRLATGSSDRMIKIWDAASGVELANLRGHESDVEDLMFFADGARLTSVSNDKTARIWDISSVDEGEGPEIACRRLGNNATLADIAAQLGLGELTPICGDNPPLPVDWSKLQ